MPDSGVSSHRTWRRQVHRGTIVNLAEIEAAVRDESGRITLKLRSRKESLAVSRVFGEQFRQM